jgi:hypothetical protein
MTPSTPDKSTPLDRPCTSAMTLFTHTTTSDGTVIAYDPVTGTSASGPTIDEALAELRRLLAGRQAA